MQQTAKKSPEKYTTAYNSDTGTCILIYIQYSSVVQVKLKLTDICDIPKCIGKI